MIKSPRKAASRGKLYFGSQVGGVKPQPTGCFAFWLSGKAGTSWLKAEKATHLVVTRKQTGRDRGGHPSDLPLPATRFHLLGSTLLVTS